MLKVHSLFFVYLISNESQFVISFLTLIVLSPPIEVI